jgi:hypothetical protein
MHLVVHLNFFSVLSQTIQYILTVSIDVSPGQCLDARTKRWVTEVPEPSAGGKA